MEYNIKYLSRMNKEDYCKWYMNEMNNLFPLATWGVDYTLLDAEQSYNNLHQIEV